MVRRLLQFESRKTSSPEKEVTESMKEELGHSRKKGLKSLKTRFFKKRKDKTPTSFERPMKFSEIAHRNTADEAEVEVHEHKGWFRVHSTNTYQDYFGGWTIS